MEKPKKALRWSCSNNGEDCRVGGKCNGSSSGASEGEEGDIFREPLNTNGHSSRKRVKLQSKASEDYSPVDLAVVPRKLRSAINKRLSQSASPPLSDSKRRQLHTLNGTQSSNGCTAERYGQNMLDQVTEDEEEVAEALTALASSITISMPMINKDKRRNVEENSETKATSTSPSEGLHELVLEVEPSTLEQPIAASISQNFDASGIETTPSNSELTLLSNNRKESDITCLRGAMNFSNPLGTSLQYLAGNGELQQAQLDASSMQKRDIELWHLGSASIEKDLPSVKQNLVSGTSPYLCKKETTGGWLGLPSTDHAQLTISSSSKTTGCQRSITASRCSSTRNDLPTEMLPPPTMNKKTPCKKCATHVYISHLVRNYQNAEKKQRSSLPNNQSKDKEGRSSFLQTSTMTLGLRNGMAPLSSGFHMDRSPLEGSSQMVPDRRLVQAHMVSTLSGPYAQQKHGGDHFSISAAGDAKNSGNGLQPSGQLPVHYLQHHSLMPFPFAGGPHSSHYQDQLTAAASQQVQLQRPQYMSTGPLYGTQMVQVTGSTATKQQQQQMWQAQLAHYGPPLGFQAKWQHNGHHPDSFQPSSSSLHTQGPSSIFPLPKDFHPPNGQPHFLLPRPSSSSSLPSRPKQQQHQHNGGTFNLESSGQLHMLCNAETFR